MSGEHVHPEYVEQFQLDDLAASVTDRLRAYSDRLDTLTARVAALESGPTPEPEPEPVRALWDGHVPGRYYAGMTLGNFYPGSHGVRRSFRSDFTSDSTEDARIKEDHAANRIPWVSFKPPNTWAEIASGQYDAGLRAKATRYRGYGKPVLVTFNHEPKDDTSRGNAAQFVDAFLHVHETFGDLNHATHTCILHGHDLIQVGDDWLPDEMIDALEGVVGVDMYRPLPELDAMADYLVSRGVRQILIGEMHRGPADSGATPETLAQFEAKLKWLADNADLVSVVCYFNSSPFGGFSGTWPNGSQYRALWDSYAAGGVRLP